MPDMLPFGESNVAYWAALAMLADWASAGMEWRSGRRSVAAVLFGCGIAMFVSGLELAALGFDWWPLALATLVVGGLTSTVLASRFFEGQAS